MGRKKNAKIFFYLLNIHKCPFPRNFRNLTSGVNLCPNCKIMCQRNSHDRIQNQIKFLHSNKHLSEIYKGFENKNKNIICTPISFPPLLLQTKFENKNISYFSFYRSQRDGVFHNQVLRCASRAPCPRGLSGERGEYQVLRTLSCYYHHTVMAFCPILPCIHPHPLHPQDKRVAPQQLHVLQLCPFTAYFIVFMDFPPIL